MAFGRLQSQWGQIASQIRSQWLCSFQPKEPQLGFFIPAMYLPDGQGEKELTAEEVELVKAKQKLDLQILASLANQGIQVKRGSQRT